jgi:hypothetical protein
MSFGNGNRE